MAFGNVMVVANGKGGVGKTTTVANLGGLFALADYRVLIVELDPQGNIARDFGATRVSGTEFLTALITGGRPPVVRGVRENLDMVLAGAELGDIGGVILSRAKRGAGSLGQMLELCLAHVAEDYDIILFDTPPGDVMIIDAALYCAAVVLIPTKTDLASLDGLEKLADRFAIVKQDNLALRLLGVLLFGVGASSKRIEATARDRVAQAVPPQIAPVFETTIRHSEGAANDVRKHGLLVHELEGKADEARKRRFQFLRDKNRKDKGDRLPLEEVVFSTRNATGLADDFEKLASEVLARWARINEETGALA